MSGVIYYGNQSKLGAIEANTNEGIFGTVNEKFRNRVKSEAIPIGYRQDVKKGKAYVRSVSGELKDYEIEIQKVDYSTARKIKRYDYQSDGSGTAGADRRHSAGNVRIADNTGWETDRSGDPCIHQDSTRGYGIFIENMLEH